MIIRQKMIAACGMNCAICSGHLREKNTCPGCRQLDKKGPEYCRKCIIKHCKILKEKGMKFCSDKCEKFPCKRLKDLDKRYRNKYDMSMIDNINEINKKGIRFFVKKQAKKYKCSKCGNLICVHNKKCYVCDKV